MTATERTPMQTVADDAATRADTWLEQTIRAHLSKAVAFYQAGRPGRARYEICRLELKLARFEGDHDRVDELAQLRLFEPFLDRRAPGGAR